MRRQSVPLSRPIVARAAALLPALFALTVTAGCGSGTSETAAPQSADPFVPPVDDAAVDACTLLSDDDVIAVLGTLAGHAPTAGVGESVCQWQSEEEGELHNVKSVTLSIGPFGTAAGDRIDGPSDFGPTDPVPGVGDGARFSNGSIEVLEFPAGQRACMIQVVDVVDNFGGRGEAMAAAAQLAERVRAQL